MFADYEVPVAASMVAKARLTANEPLFVFTCYWTAFNNIYVAIAERSGRRAELRRNPDGSIRTRVLAQVTIPQVTTVSEHDQIDLAFQHFSNDLKRQLIEHPAARFFVDRTPSWRGRAIGIDASGQRLNGVLNVGYTISAKHPVWSPIDSKMFEDYLSGTRDDARRDALAKQILDVLYTVRNNTFHGGKSADDASDREVIQNAIPLLTMVVGFFLPTS